MAKTFKFYGVCNNMYKLDDTVWEAIEDENDGYRSYLDSIVKRDNDGIFFPSPIAEVRVDACPEYDKSGFQLVDVKDGHIWLKVGTDNFDDWYPCFCFEYHPKEGLSENGVYMSEWEMFVKGL